MPSSNRYVLRGMREASARGFWINTHVPFGYEKELVEDGGRKRTKLVPDPASASLVQRIFEMAGRGNSLRNIAKTLNAEGFTTAKGRHWRTSQVHKILSNEVYTGTLIWGRNAKDGLPPVRVEGAFRAIVSREQFDDVRARLREKAPDVMHPRRAGSTHLLSGLAKCGLCRKTLVAQGAKSGRYHYYVCGRILQEGAGACECPRVNSKKFERRVIEEIRTNVLTEENVGDLAQLVADEMESVESEAQQMLTAIEHELGDVRRAVERLWSAVETSGLEVRGNPPAASREAVAPGEPRADRRRGPGCG